MAYVQPVTSNSPAGQLTLGHVFAAAGIDEADVAVIRHTPASAGFGPMVDPDSSELWDYTRRQGHRNKLGEHPPRLWVVFSADGGLRSRFLTVFANHGEQTELRDKWRYFDLRPSELLSSLRRRLLIEWSKDPVNWAKTGAAAASFPILEISDPAAVPFPGFDNVLLDHATLHDVVFDSRYAEWQTALRSVQGVYLLADTSTGQLYVGKADGSERILGRWTQYASDGHGGNKGLRELGALDADHARHFQFSILRVFGPSVPPDEVNAAEAHFKKALLTRTHGLNRN